MLDDEDPTAGTGGWVGDGDGDGVGGGGGEGTTNTGGESVGGNGGELGNGGAPGDRPVPCSTTCAEPLLLYRSFEIGIPLGVKEDIGASVDRCKDPVQRDVYSLCTTQGAPETDAQITEQIRPVVGSHLYYRAYVYVPEGAINDWVKVLAFNGALTEGIDVNLLAGGAVQIYSQISTESVQSEGSLSPVNDWFCLQVHSFVDNVNGSVEVSINEEQVVSMNQIDTLPGISIDNIVYGLAETGPEQTGATLYFDEIVASTEPVSCDPL